MKRVVVELNDELHLKLKISAVSRGISVKQLVTELIQKDLKREERRDNAGSCKG